MANFVEEGDGTPSPPPPLIPAKPDTVLQYRSTESAGEQATERYWGWGGAPAGLCTCSCLCGAPNIWPLRLETSTPLPPNAEPKLQCVSTEHTCSR